MYTQFTDPIVFSIQFCSSAPPAIIMQRVHNNCTCPLRGFKNRKSKKRKKVMDMYQCNAILSNQTTNAKGVVERKKNMKQYFPTSGMRIRNMILEYRIGPQLATKGISLLRKNLILSSVKSIRAMNEQYL
jgi:hypothetical protein